MNKAKIIEVQQKIKRKNIASEFGIAANTLSTTYFLCISISAIPSRSFLSPWLRVNEIRLYVSSIPLLEFLEKVQKCSTVWYGHTYSELIIPNTKKDKGKLIAGEQNKKILYGKTQGYMVPVFERYVKQWMQNYKNINIPSWIHVISTCNQRKTNERYKSNAQKIY